MNKTLKIGGTKIAVRENIVDRIVNYFDPVKGKKRFQSRVAMALSGSYFGALKSRRSLSEWKAKEGSPDADILLDLPELRSRSRDLVRNSPLATGAVNTVCTSVVGTGLKFQPRIDRDILNMSEKFRKIAQWLQLID